MCPEGKVSKLKRWLAPKHFSPSNKPITPLPDKKLNTVVGLANATLDADGKVIYVAENLKVGLFKSWKE